MSQSTHMHFCKECQKKTPHLQEDVNHILHLLLTVCTFGFWLIIWFIAMCMNDAPDKTCTICGKISKNIKGEWS